MRKIIVLAAIIILTLVLTGCGNGNIASKQKATNKSTQQSNNDTRQQAGNDTQQQPNPKDSSTGSAAIVAKSENIMSSSEKEALLNQVDKELDSLFNNINNLEDAKDADLDLNQK